MAQVNRWNFCVFFLCCAGSASARSLVDVSAGLRYEQADQQTSRDLVLPEGEAQHAVPTVGLGWQIQSGLTDLQQRVTALGGSSLVDEGDFYAGRYDGAVVYADATQLHRLSIGAEQTHDETFIGRVSLRQQLDEAGLAEEQKRDLVVLKAESYSRILVGQRTAVTLYLLTRSFDRQQITKTHASSLGWEYQPSDLWTWQLTANGSQQSADATSTASYGPDLQVIRIFGVGGEVGVGAGQRWVDDQQGQTTGTSGRLHYQKRDEAYLFKLLAERSLSASTTGITTYQTDTLQLTAQRSLARSQRLSLSVTQKLEAQLDAAATAGDIESLVASAGYAYGFGGAAATINEQFRHEVALDLKSEDLRVGGFGKAMRTEIAAGYTGHF